MRFAFPQTLKNIPFLAPELVFDVRSSSRPDTKRRHIPLEDRWQSAIDLEGRKFLVTLGGATLVWLLEAARQFAAWAYGQNRSNMPNCCCDHHIPGSLGDHAD